MLGKGTTTLSREIAPRKQINTSQIFFVLLFKKSKLKNGFWDSTPSPQVPLEAASII